MSDHHSSPFPSCFRPPSAPAAAAAAAVDHLRPPEAPAGSGNPNLATCVYHTDLGIFTLTWSRNFFGRSLHLQLHPSAAANLSPLSLSNPLSLSTPAFHLHIKPFVFWKKYGSKKLHVAGAPGGRDIRVFWDLTRAKFGSWPEPQHGFYVAVVADGEMILLVGDSEKEAYNKTRAKKAERTQVLVLRREHVFGNKVYTTRASFGGKTREISIDCSVGDDPRLSFSVDRKRVLQIKRLKWKFRGNEKIEVDGIPIQVSWDVYNWLFDDVMESHAVFMFKFERLGFEEEDEELQQQQHLNEKNGMALCGFGMNGIERKKMKKSLLKTTRSSSSSSLSSASSGCSSSVMEWASTEEMELKSPSGFSLLVYAWKS